MKNKFIMPLIVIASLLILGLVTTASYAYFTANVVGNNEANNTVIKTGNMALELEDGPEVYLKNAIPGTSTTKTFKVKNTGTVSTVYDVYLSELINKFVDKNDLVYTLESTNGCSSEQKVVPYLGKEDAKIVSSCSIEPNREHEYTLTINFIEDNTNQDDNKGRSFSARISVNEYNEPEQIAMLQRGATFNSNIKMLAGTPVSLDESLIYSKDLEFLDNNGGTIYNEATNDTINNILISDIEPSTDMNVLDVSAPNSYYPILAWFDNGIIYLYTQANKIYFNYNSTLTFHGLTSIKNLNLQGFDVSKVTNMNYMFYFLRNMTELNLGDSFDTSNVENMNNMFAYDMSLVNLNLGNKFNTSNVKYMTGMFAQNASLKSLDLGKNFDTSKVEVMQGMFYYDQALQTLNLGDKFDTSNVKIMTTMFYYNESLKSLDLGDKFNTSKVTDMASMFQGTKSLTKIDVSSFDTSNVTNMSRMFCDCYRLESIDLSSFNTSKVTDMRQMFKCAYAIKSINFGENFDTSKVTDMNQMFMYNHQLTTLDLGPKFDVSSVELAADMFQDYSKPTRTIYAQKDLVFKTNANVTNMFWGTVGIVGGRGTPYTNTKVNAEYAVIDCGTKRPGYLTFRGTEEEYEAFCSQFD